jgi:hypothetical protein
MTNTNILTCVVVSVLLTACDNHTPEPTIYALTVSDPVEYGQWVAKTGSDSNGEAFGFLIIANEGEAVMSITCLSDGRLNGYTGTINRPSHDLLYMMIGADKAGQAVLPLYTDYWNVYGGIYASFLTDYELGYVMDVWRDSADVVLSLTEDQGVSYEYGLSHVGFNDAFDAVCKSRAKE